MAVISTSYRAAFHQSFNAEVVRFFEQMLKVEVARLTSATCLLPITGAAYDDSPARDASYTR
jgi:hypothetical protein